MSEIKCARDLPVLKFTKSQQRQFREKIENQVISEPTDELLTIYEKRILHEISYLRAEKYDSPEWQKELKKIQAETGNKQVPRNNQNPNYDKLIGYYEQFLEEQTLEQAVETINELYEFMTSFKFMPHFDLKLARLSPCPDPRCFETEPNLYFCYLITKYLNTLVEREEKVFNKLTNKAFDDESIKETIQMLKDTITKPKDYSFLAQQILEAVGEENNKFKLLESCNLKQPEDASDLEEFLNYLFYFY